MTTRRIEGAPVGRSLLGCDGTAARGPAPASLAADREPLDRANANQVERHGHQYAGPAGVRAGCARLTSPM